MENKNLYKDCSELPIFNFFELVRTKDFKFLFKKEVDLDKYDEEELFKLLMDIFLEYNEITENKKLLQELQAKLDIEYMQARYEISKHLLSIYLETGDINVLFGLKEFKWTIDTSKNIMPQVERITKSLIGLKNQINIKKINFVKRFQKQTKETQPNFNLDRSVISLEIGIPLSYKINIHKDSIKRYVYWHKALEDKQKLLKHG